MGCAPLRKKITVNKNNDDKKDDKLKLVFQSARIIQKHISPYTFYQEIQYIGEGQYSKVYKVLHKSTNTYRAMKVSYKRDNMTKEDEEIIISEFNILKSLNHPNIVKVYELYDFDNSYYFISELIDGGTLSSKLDSVKLFKESQASHIMFQILSALNFCHKNNILHKDLNLDNILILNSKEEVDFHTIKIIDFGSSNKVYDSGNCDIIGTPVFMSPEAIDGEITELNDSWACGVIAYCLLLGDIPFYSTNEDEMLNNLLEGKFNRNSRYDKLSLPAQEFIEKTLTVSVKTRASITTAINLKFIENSRKRSKLFLNNDKLRLIASKIMQNTDNDKILIKAATGYIVHNLLKPTDTEMFRKIFNELNESNDGRLTKEQIQIGFKNIMNPSELEEFVKRTFENIDDDNNGFIEFEEFVTGCLDKKKFFTKSNISHAFKYLSSYGSTGKIQFSDLKKLILGKITNEEGGEINNNNNSNLNNPIFQYSYSAEEGKNKLSNDEENKLIKKAIKEFDDNDDGEISFSEFYKVMNEAAGIDDSENNKGNEMSKNGSQTYYSQFNNPEKLNQLVNIINSTKHEDKH